MSLLKDDLGKKSTRLKATRRRGSNNFSKSDRLTIAGFVGIPTILHILFVWVPAICTILLSFTFWDGIVD